MRAAGAFCALNRSGLEAFDAIKYSTAYPKGAVLFVEGQVPRGIFVLCQGRVGLSMCGRGSNRLILDVAEPGEALGLSAAITGTRYELTAETMEPCQTNFVQREDFLRLLKENSEACLTVAEHLSHTCNALCSKVRLLGLPHTAEERLAKLLLELSHRRGVPGTAGAPLNTLLTHGEIGQMIGATRETVSRIVSRLKKRCILQVDGASTVIRNEAALRALANDGQDPDLNSVRV